MKSFENFDIYYNKGLEGHINIVKKKFDIALEHINKKIGLNFPQSPLKIVFVDSVIQEPIIYDGMCLFSIYHLFELNNIQANFDFYDLCSQALSKMIFMHTLSPRYS